MSCPAIHNLEEPTLGRASDHIKWTDIKFQVLDVERNEKECCETGSNVCVLGAGDRGRLLGGDRRARPRSSRMKHRRKVSLGPFFPLPPFSEPSLPHISTEPDPVKSVHSESANQITPSGGGEGAYKSPAASG